MLIDLQAMRKVHNVQYEMMKQLAVVLEELGLDYYFVHGSLLGAITLGDFIPEDDDIDIALFREDYNKLVQFGNQLLPEGLFIQSSLNDHFPLAFAKMRNSETAFIQPVLDGYSCNKGIYIDIFPIDYVANSKFEALKEKLVNSRLNSRIKLSGVALLKRSARFFSKVVFPSWKKAAVIREDMLTKRAPGKQIRLTNGKPGEQCMPIEWFGTPVSFRFRSLDILCPPFFGEYLSRIYGSCYMTTNPAADRITSDHKVKVSADIIDSTRSYKKWRNVK